MTLIIGFVCKDGICLVSDTKITNPETLEPKFASKILTPLRNTPFIVGAAGYTDLFHEFNRKIVERVDQSIRQYKIANIEQLMRTGMSREEAISTVQKYQKDMSSSQQALEEPKEETKEIVTDIELPYIYTAENFLDDCKDLIGEITKNSGYANPIELLLGLRDNIDSFPRLYKIDARGHEETISDWTAIGSGEPFAKMFFSELYDHEKSANDLVKDCFRAITFVQNIGKENSVGYSAEFPPQAVVIDSIQGVNVYGRVRYENAENVLKEIEEETKQFSELIKDSKTSMLKESS